MKEQTKAIGRGERMRRWPSDEGLEGWQDGSDGGALVHSNVNATVPSQDAMDRFLCYDCPKQH